MFKLFNENEIFLYDIQISDEFDGMMRVSDYLKNVNYKNEDLEFISKCLSVFSENGWEQQDISVFKIIGFPLSVQDFGSCYTKKAVVIKQCNNGTTLILSEMKLPDYYDRFRIKHPNIPDCNYKYYSFLVNLLPENGDKDAT